MGGWVGARGAGRVGSGQIGRMQRARGEGARLSSLLPCYSTTLLTYLRPGPSPSPLSCPLCLPLALAPRPPGEGGGWRCLRPRSTQPLPWPLPCPAAPGPCPLSSARSPDYRRAAAARHVVVQLRGRPHRRLPAQHGEPDRVAGHGGPGAWGAGVRVRGGVGAGRQGGRAPCPSVQWGRQLGQLVSPQ